ncbi:hypothetical protein HII31_00521 [Pseudocercospora fuligena]|uniref:F-box domain-containing protein n=1 Tax=Pseudocercospora fuligena TaxID=685502 RepID=A0A8H6RUL3_9PEZI|nr:hypothetical protein HII31_00521 [Pseudocercospora fuligena]
MAVKRKTLHESSGRSSVSSKRPRKTRSHEVGPRSDVNERNTHLQTLPEELWSSIFSRLSFSRDDIASCRLVCHYFKRLSSEYLITYAVLANRLPAYKKLLELTAHPYFSKHVTELLVDGSDYSKDLAREPEEYIDACKYASRDLRRDDSAWKQVEEENQAMFQDLDQDMPNGLPLSRVEQSNNWMRAYDRTEQKNYIDSWMLYRSNREWSKSARTLKMPERAIRQAFRKLLMLRHITLTDFRGLAKQGESYDKLCLRLFGGVLEAHCLQAKARSWKFVNTVLQALYQTPEASIDSFSIGKQPFFEIPGLVEWTRPEREIVHQQLCMPVDAMFVARPIQDTPILYDRVLSRVRRLDLAITFPTRYQRDLRQAMDDDQSAAGYNLVDIFRDFILAAPPNLCHLGIHVSHMTKRDVLTQLGLGRDLVDITGLLFDLLVSQLELPKLRHLDLRGFEVSATALVSFLDRHKSTIEELRLLDNCILFGNSQCEQVLGNTPEGWEFLEKGFRGARPMFFGSWNLAEWAARNLNLRGIEFCNLNDGTYMDLQKGPLSDQLVLAPDEQYLSRPQIHSDRWTDGYGYMFRTADTVKEGRKTMESLWLNGRPNMLDREYDCSHSDPIEYNSEQPFDWYTKPRYWN